MKFLALHVLGIETPKEYQEILDFWLYCNGIHFLILSSWYIGKLLGVK